MRLIQYNIGSLALFEFNKKGCKRLKPLQADTKSKRASSGSTATSTQKVILF